MADESTAIVTIVNRLGLHARPAMVFVDTAARFQSEIVVHRCDRPDELIDGKSIMQMMMLAAVQGTEIEVCAKGPDHAEAIEALRCVVAEGFGEE
ncbi:MAG: HPr family phosphocarrier protein [Phycisphaerales bacterium]